VNLANQSTDHPTLELSYIEELRSVLLSKLETSPMEFGVLVANAEGAYPTDVMTVITALAADNEVSESNGLWFLRNQDQLQNKSPAEVSVANGSESDLPEPHPLDFDWRFTEDTLACIERDVNARNGGKGAILGAPTLYKYLMDLGADVTLYDKNAGVVEHLRNSGYSSLNEVDLTRSLEFSPLFRWAIADPPWYTEHYEGFLSAASQLLLPAGKVFLSVLPRLTRASAAADRFRIIEVAKKIGFDLVDVKPGGLGYASPPFEIEALREEGLEVGNWRKAICSPLFCLRLEGLNPRFGSRTMKFAGKQFCWEQRPLESEVRRPTNLEPLVISRRPLVEPHGCGQYHDDLQQD
jgi:hypothetical protein